jgi:ketosteroid isomerase-like protein
MKLNLRTLLPVAALVLVAACAQQDSAYVEADAATADVEKVDLAAFEQSLQAIEDAYIEGYNGGDAAALAALFAEDGQLSPPLSPALDRAGIEAMYAASFEAGTAMVLEVMREDFMVFDDMAVGWGAFQVTGTPAEGEPFTANGRYGSIMRMDPDGTWKLFRHMFNYEVPPPGFGQ